MNGLLGEKSRLSSYIKSETESKTSKNAEG
jgi:hypothetical protein